MFISKTAAQAIVEEIGEEINEQINMMDSSGTIIASTDDARIGQTHEGAVRIIREGLKELFITEEMETDTTKRGINLPLIVNGDIVGVVGITGERERVMRYGNIVRRMTEIMVEDSMEKDARRYDRRMRFRYMEEWISRADAAYEQHFIERGKRLGIDILSPRRVMILRLTDFDRLSDSLEGQRLMEELETTVRHAMEEKNILYLRRPPEQIGIFPDCSDEMLLREGRSLQERIRKQYHCEITLGIDSRQGDRGNIRRHCEEAEKALSYALFWGEEGACYDSLNVELFLSEVSEKTMQEYLDKVFGHPHRDQLGGYMQLIAAYFTYEGSIQRMAEALFMHKNTLQYKLRKLAELTGCDIRLPSNTAVYQMALTFYRRLYQNTVGRGETLGELGL